jgi:predicted flap endonuclease-1-like 5' DNA nuclease
VQDRIRELAYMMWETAGRQQGMASEYWLAAEREVLKTMQRAAEAIMPSSGKAASKPAAKPVETKPAAKAEPQPAPKAEAKPAPKAEPQPAPKAEAKPAPKAEAKPEVKPAAQPAPKATPEPVPAGPMSIEEIEGIGPAFAKKLKAAGIATPAELLAKCGAAKGRKAVVDHTGIPMKRVLRWVNMADLMRLKGVDGNAAELLEAAGVDTVKALASERADSLASTMASVNAAKNLAPSVPDAKTVAAWIAEAKTLEPKVTH